MAVARPDLIPSRSALLRLLLAGVLAALVATVQAQPFRGFGFFRVPARFATDKSFDGGFNFCRVWFSSVRREDGGMGWWTDYPAADQNFMIRFGELTKATVSRDKTGEPNFLVVRITDDAFYRCPFAILEDAGTVGFSEDEIGRLRTYLLKGGFIWADDYWGDAAWEQWVNQISLVLPPGEYPIFDIEAGHPMFRTLYEVTHVPQIPSIQHWRRSGGETSERGSESATVHFRGINDAKGRLIVLMSHNTDIADGWEREGEDPHFFQRFSIESYALAINVVIHAMTH
jgi:hypothetical protein